MYLDEYVKQFDGVQPIGIMCKGCGETYVLLKGLQKGESLALPQMCAYCGKPLDYPIYDKEKLN